MHITQRSKFHCWAPKVPQQWTNPGHLTPASAAHSYPQNDGLETMRIRVQTHNTALSLPST
jgi:hypothetical protein